jgi:hypothetical protein
MSWATIIDYDPMVGRRLTATPANIIRVSRDTLCAYRDDGRVSSDWLLKDIEAYDKILTSKDPERRAAKFFEEKRKNPILRPHEIAWKLHWTRRTNDKTPG